MSAEPDWVDDGNNWVPFRERLWQVIAHGFAYHASVCGSYALGAAGPDSDLDIRLLPTSAAMYVRATEFMVAYQGRGLDFGMIWRGEFYRADHVREDWARASRPHSRSVKFLTFAEPYLRPEPTKG